jgi:RNA polymerase sigma factor (sigma-70 family)
MWTMDTELAPPLLSVRAAPKRLTLSGDERLAQLIRRGDEAAFAALYERYYQRLYRYCRSMLHNDADAQDALQSTFAGVFSALSQGRRNAPMRPWLYRIAYNESVSVMRRRRPEVALTDAHEIPATSTEELVAGRARLALLVADLRELTERQRGALVMRELSGLSHEEIATVFDISVGAAKQTIFEARRSLAEFAEGRAMACDAVCRAVSEGNGRVLRGRKLRAHLRECGSCAAFAAAIPSRSRDLRAIAPPLSAVAAAGLLRRSLAAGSGHSAGGGGAAATGAGAATASTGAGSGAATAGGVGTGTVGTGAVGSSAVGSGSATVAAGVVTKAAGLAVVAKAAVGVAVLATAAAGAAGVVSHFDSSSSRGLATAKALRQTSHHAGSAAQTSVPAGTGDHATAAAAAATAGRTSGHAAARHRGKGHRAAHVHGSAASAVSAASPKAGAQAHGNSQVATKSQGVNGVAGAKSPGAPAAGSAAKVHSSSSRHSASGAAQPSRASSTHPVKVHRTSHSTASGHATTSQSSATHPAHRSGRGGAAGSSQPAHPAPAGSSAAGTSNSK